MGPRPWWQRILQFLRECLCFHDWKSLDGAFSTWRYCRRCEATEAPKYGPSILRGVIKEMAMLRVLERYHNRETKHETSDWKDDGGPQGRG